MWWDSAVSPADLVQWRALRSLCYVPDAGTVCGELSMTGCNSEALVALGQGSTADRWPGSRGARQTHSSEFVSQDLQTRHFSEPSILFLASCSFLTETLISPLTEDQADLNLGYGPSSAVPLGPGFLT